ncbi:MAG: hypothetical protein IAE93_05950 [Ignavibacteria bacterium]|nr:hypothetical protein [Ignavibacteria bacterium]
MEKVIIKIYFGYSWEGKGLEKNSYKAFNEITTNAITNILNSKTFIKDSFVITSRRLRGSAGGYLLDKIFKMIKEADILIYDITSNNPNVMFELGIAYAIQKESNPNLRLFLIREKNMKEKDLNDLNGYFISEYSIKNSKVRFEDQGSLLQSIISTLKSTLLENNLLNPKISELSID